jgi:hypothetical protein
MNDIVPGALQRLREADIIGLAGLAGASMGQEYARSGYVSATKRLGVYLSGTVILPDMSPEPVGAQLRVEQLEEAEESPGISSASMAFEVEVKVASPDSCHAVCTCGNQATLICAHAASLLYHWIYHPYTFISLLPSSTPDVAPASSGDSTRVSLNNTRVSGDALALSAAFTPSTVKYTPLPVRNLPVNTIGETLTQLSLSELRSVAREYSVGATNLGKQQLVETMIETLSQPEAIRRVVATLSKPQRQLLAAFALAGGSMSDEELRGLFERFALDNAGTLQEMLVALQAKLLLVRTSFNHSLQQRLNLPLSPLDISWYIPQEVRSALHVTLPVTRFDVTAPYGKNGDSALPLLHLAEPYKLLADMLLVARALDGAVDEQPEKRSSRGIFTPAADRQSADGSLALTPPDDQPSLVMIDSLLTVVQRSPAYLRFVVRLLRQANILYKEENWSVRLRVLPNAAQLLLGPARNDMLHDLFTHWVSQTSYAELFELAERGTRVRCRATPLSQPALRRGELEQENSEARQEVLTLLAQVTVGEWINFSAFARFIYRLHPTFLQRRQHLFPLPHWWIEEQEGRPLRPTQFSDWLRAEGRYLAALLQGPLHWWGICDLAFSSSDQLLAFRLTPLAGFLFRGIALASQQDLAGAATPKTPVLTVSAGEQVLVACSPANWPLIACIEDFAESAGVQHEQLSYRLSAQSMSEAMSKGYNPRDLLALLGQADLLKENNPLEQLLASLERRIANYGRVRLYTDVSLVQVADLSMMQQLGAITTLSEQTIRSIHPTLLILKKQGVERLLEELKRRGQAPLLHEEV